MENEKAVTPLLDTEELIPEWDSAKRQDPDHSIAPLCRVRSGWCCDDALVGRDEIMPFGVRSMVLCCWRINCKSRQADGGLFGDFAS